MSYIEKLEKARNKSTTVNKYKQPQGFSSTPITTTKQSTGKLQYDNPDVLAQVLEQAGGTPKKPKANALQRLGKAFNILNFADPLTRIVKRERNPFEAFTKHFSDTGKSIWSGDLEASKTYGTGDLLKASGIDLGVVNTGLNILDPLDLSMYTGVGAGKNIIGKGGTKAVSKGTKLFKASKGLKAVDKVGDVQRFLNNIDPKLSDEFSEIIFKSDKITTAKVRDGLTKVMQGDTAVSKGLAKFEDGGLYAQLPFSSKRVKIGGDMAGKIAKPIVDPISTVLSPVWNSGIGRAVRGGISDVVERTGEGLQDWFSRNAKLKRVGGDDVANWLETMERRVRAVGDDTPELVNKNKDIFAKLTDDQTKQFAKVLEYQSGIKPKLEGLESIKGLAENNIRKLKQEGITDLRQLGDTTSTQIARTLNISIERAESIQKQAKRIFVENTQKTKLIDDFEKLIYNTKTEKVVKPKYKAGDLVMPEIKNTPELKTKSVGVEENEMISDIAQDIKQTTNNIKELTEAKVDGWHDIRGHKIEEPTDLGNLLKRHRHPDKEVMHAVYTGKDGKILGHTAITSNAYNYVQPSQKEILLKLEGRGKRLGADGLYLAHNHPSGNIKPSPEDINFTGALAKKLDNSTGNVKLKGHVILDHDKMTNLTFDRAGNSIRGDEFPIKLGENFEGVGDRLEQPDVVAEQIRNLWKPKNPETEAFVMIVNPNQRIITTKSINPNPTKLNETIKQLIKENKGVRSFVGIHEKAIERFMDKRPEGGYDLNIIQDLVVINDKGGFNTFKKGFPELFKDTPTEIKSGVRMFDSGGERIVKPKLADAPNDLLQEARKYKTPDEFVKAQGRPVYHSTKSSNIDSINKSGFNVSANEAIGNKKVDGVFFFDDINQENYVKGEIKKAGINDEIKTVESYIDKNAKIEKYKSIDDFDDEFVSNKEYLDADFGKGEREIATKILKNKGIDVAIVPYGGGNEIIVINPKVIKTKSQLENIWKEANTTTPQSPKLFGIDKQASETINTLKPNEKLQALKTKESTLLREVAQLRSIYGKKNTSNAQLNKILKEGRDWTAEGGTPIDKLNRVYKEIGRQQSNAVRFKNDKVVTEITQKIKEFNSDPAVKEVLDGYKQLQKDAKSFGRHGNLRAMAGDLMDDYDMIQSEIIQMNKQLEDRYTKLRLIEDGIGGYGLGSYTKLKWIPEGTYTQLKKYDEVIEKVSKELKPEFAELKPLIQQIQGENLRMVPAMRRTGAPMIENSIGYIHRNTFQDIPSLADLGLPASTIAKLKEAGINDALDISTMNKIELGGFVKEPQKLIDQAQVMKVRYDKGVFRPSSKAKDLRAKTVMGDSAKNRKVDTILEGEAKGVKYDLDTKEGLIKAITEQNITQRRVKILDDAYHQLPTLRDTQGNKLFLDSRVDNIDKSMMSNLAKELDINPKTLPDDSPIKHLWGDSRVIAELKKAHQRFIDPNYMDKSFGVIDKANTLWKQAVTTLGIPIPWIKDGKLSKITVPIFPAFSIRNDVSGMTANSMFADVWNPKRYKDSVIVGSYRRAIESGNKAQIKKLANREIVDGLTVKDFHDAYKELGGYSSSFTTNIDDLLRRKAKDKTGFQKVMESTSARGFNEFIEQKNRMALFIDQIQKGKTTDEAYQKVIDLHMDYSKTNYTDFENNIMLRLVPFYKFMKGNISLHVKTGLTDPSRMSKILKFYGNVPDMFGENLTEEDKENLPDWLQDSMYIGLGKKGDNASVITGFGTYSESLNDIWGTSPKKSLQNFLNMTSPIFKTPVELATGQNLFKNKAIIEDNNGYFAENLPEWLKDSLGYKEVPYTKSDGTMGVMPKVDPIKKYWFNVLFGRAVSQTGKMANLGDSGEVPLDLLSILSGTKVQKFDMEREKENRRREKVSELEELLQREGVGNTYSNFYINEATRDEYGLEELMRGGTK